MAVDLAPGSPDQPIRLQPSTNDTMASTASDAGASSGSVPVVAAA